MSIFTFTQKWKKRDTMTTVPSNELITKIKVIGDRLQGLQSQVQKNIVGQQEIIDKICIGLLCGGHILLEGLPGLAKTTLVKSFAQALGFQFSRIQFTPDLLPSDLIGTLVFNPKTHEFETKKGPIFAHFVLADEINRAPAKVQSALLEAMQEKQVTLGDRSYELASPFLVLATQNPIEQEGTYRLPEAQLDRFMFKLHITYPSEAEEKEIIHQALHPKKIHPIVNTTDLAEAQSVLQQIYVDEKIHDYIVKLVFATRKPSKYGLEHIQNYIGYGVSPRATLTLRQACCAHALMQKRHFVIPDDVKAVLPETFRHRLLLSYEAEAENITSDEVISSIVKHIACP